MVALLDSAVAAPSLVIPAFGRVKVIHGPNDEMFSNLVGISVAAVRHLLAEPFNIPADAVAFVNGERVGSLYRLERNETLEFVREWGRKGGDEKLASFRPGDAVLTKRIKKRCKELGFAVREEKYWNGWGYQIVAYHGPRSIVDEEMARRNAEKEEAEREREKKRAEAEEAKVAALMAKFPKLRREVIESLPNRWLYLPSEVGYQFGIGTKSYWEQLGFRVSGDSSGWLVRSSRLYPVYRSSSLTEKKQTSTVGRVWQEWYERHGSEAVVLAEALRLANRLQKVKSRAGFYPLKDEWIKRNQNRLLEGRIARLEERVCWDCNGGGESRWGEDCFKCGGTGLYSSSILYEHLFEIEGRKYCFHSYVRPASLSDEPGANLAHYGRPFAADELPLPPQSLLIEMVEFGLSRKSVD